MAKIIIIGAGLTGISAAYHLEQAGFTDFKIFEKEDSVGGLCRSVYQDSFTFDYTGHLLHISDPYFENLINSLVQRKSFNTIQRRSYIYSYDTYTNYPYQTNLYGLPQDVITECVEQFVNRPKKQTTNNFYSWAVHKFGRGIAKHFFTPYQNKIFAYDIRKITSSWTGRFVPKTSLQQIISGALSNKQKDVGYNANFLYPKQGGIFYWVNKLAQALHTKIETGFCVNQIDLKNKIVYFSNGHFEQYEQLVSTMPLKTFLKYTKESSTQNFSDAKQKLICNSVVNFNLGINRPDLSDKHWIYYPEKEYPFYRIGFPHNFTHHATPPGCSSLYGEFSYINKSQKHLDETLKLSLQKTKELLKISNSDIATQKIIHIPHAYVIYNHWREKNLPKLLKTLEMYDVYSCGRYGAWKYSSMQEAVLDGKEVVEKILKLHSSSYKFKNVFTKTSIFK